MQTNMILPPGTNDYVDLRSEYLELFDNEFIPLEVCHYTTRDRALEKILDSKKIRAGQLAFTNDPRESKPWKIPATVWLEDLTADWEQRSIPYMSKLQEEVNRIKGQEWRVLCMTCHNDPNLNFFGSAKKEYNHVTYGFSHSRMWAQYAENHSGVCLVFDGKQLDDNIYNCIDESCQIFHGFVRYDYQRSTELSPADNERNFQIEDLTERIRKNSIAHYDSYFLYKSEEWKAEHEFRWLIHTEDSSEILIPIETAIKAIIVGVDYPRAYEINLRVLAKELNIPVGRMGWEKGMPYVRRNAIYQP